MVLRWQKSHPEFDLADLITERNGKVSHKKFSVMVALIITSWIMVTVTAQGKMSYEYVALYAGIWCGYRAYVETKSHQHEPNCYHRNSLCANQRTRCVQNSRMAYGREGEGAC